MQNHIPGVMSCHLTGMTEGSIIVDYEIIISTSKAAQVISDPTSIFSNYDLDNLLNDSGSQVESVLQDETFIASVISQVSNARAAASKSVIDIMPTDAAACNGETGCPFIPTATVNYVRVFEESCNSNCAENEILYHAGAS